MRKLQAGNVPAAEQANAKPVSPEPRKEWPRWKKIAAVVSLAGGALGLGACKKCEQLFEPGCEIPASFSADPQSKERLVKLAKENWQYCDGDMHALTLMNLSDIANGAGAERQLRERIIEVFKKAYEDWKERDDFVRGYALQRLVRFALENGAAPGLRDYVVDKLENGVKDVPFSLENPHPFLSALAEFLRIAQDPGTEPKLRAHMAEVLLGLGYVPPSLEPDVANGLVTIARDDRTEPVLRERVLAHLEERKMRPVSDLSPAIALAFGDISSNTETESAFDAFEKALDDENETVRHDAMYALRLLVYKKSEVEMGKLVSILEGAFGGKTTDVHLEALSLLSEIVAHYDLDPRLTERVTHVFARALKEDSDNLFRISRGLGLIANSGAEELRQKRRVIRILEAASHNKSEAVRKEAIVTLEGILEATPGTETATIEAIARILYGALHDESEDVRLLADDAIEDIPRCFLLRVHFGQSPPSCP